MNVTVAVEEVHIGDQIPCGGPLKTVTWKTEHDGKVTLGFERYLSSQTVVFDRGTLVDIKVSEGDLKAYIVYDGDSMQSLSVIPHDEKVGIVWE